MSGKVGRFIEPDSTVQSLFTNFMWNLFDVTTSQSLLHFQRA